MNADFQRRIQQYGWDRAAPYYESGWQDQLWPAQEMMLVEADPQEGEHILDVSCGTGLVTFPLAEIVGEKGQVFGIDISEGMIDKANQELTQQYFKNIQFTVADAEAIPFKDNYFNSVICSLGFMYFPVPEKAMKEMVRVVKPGGKITTLVWGERKNCGWASIFPIVDGHVQSDVCPLFFRLGNKNTLSALFRKTGLTTISENRFTVNLHFRNKEQACKAAFLGGAVALAYQKFNDKTKKEVRREFILTIEQYRIGLSYDVPGEFVIVSGVK